MAMTKIWTPAFDGSDTHDAVETFLANGGEVTKCRYNSPNTGAMKFYNAKRAQEAKQGEA